MGKIGYDLKGDLTVHLERAEDGLDEMGNEINNFLIKLKAFGVRTTNARVHILVNRAPSAFYDISDNMMPSAISRLDGFRERLELRLKDSSPNFTGKTLRSTDSDLEEIFFPSHGIQISLIQDPVETNDGSRGGKPGRFSYAGPVHDNRWNKKTGRKQWMAVTVEESRLGFRRVIESAIIRATRI